MSILSQTTIYQTAIIEVGNLAHDALLDNMMITFKQGAPADLAEFCFIHSHSENCGELTVGCYLQLGQHTYPITAVGEVANQNLRELGHITIRFDGATQAQMSGAIHVNGVAPKQITVGTEFKIIKN